MLLHSTSNNAAVVCGMPPNLTDGTVKVNGTTYRSVANYSCQPGYQQTGQNNTAICQANGNWSDVGIQCVQGTHIHWLAFYMIIFLL